MNLLLIITLKSGQQIRVLDSPKKARQNFDAWASSSASIKAIQRIGDAQCQGPWMVDLAEIAAMQLIPVDENGQPIAASQSPGQLPPHASGWKYN